MYTFASNFHGSLFLTGEIPVSLGNCINLTDLCLNFNKLQGKCSIRVHFCLETLLNPFFWQVKFQNHLEIVSSWCTLCSLTTNSRVSVWSMLQVALKFLEVVVFLQERSLNHLETVPSWRIFNSGATNWLVSVWSVYTFASNFSQFVFFDRRDPSFTG